jgi:dihydrofolate reductase
MRNLVLVVHVSLDGYVAGPNGELDWFPKGDENLGLVNEIIINADATLMGRVSYKLLDQYWPSAFQKSDATKNEKDFSNWYNSISKIVVSKKINESNYQPITIINENIVEKIDELKKSLGKDIIIFGSPSLSQMLISRDLIDSFWIFVNPIIFGKGIHLYEKIDKKIQFQLLSSTQLSNGEIALNYKLINKK